MIIDVKHMGGKMKSLNEISRIIANELGLDVNEKELEGMITSNIPDVEHIAKFISRKKNEIILPDGASEDLVEYVKERYADEFIDEGTVGSIIVSSGCSLEGYDIIKYSDFIAADASTIMSRKEIFGGNRKILAETLSTLRNNAKNKLRKAASEMGCNAIIGAEYDYITYTGEQVTGPNVINIGLEGIPNLICVTVSGTAVVAQAK